MEELPEDILAKLNGDDRDSNLLPTPKRPELSSDLQERLEEYNRNFEALTSALGEASMLDAAATTELKIEKTRDMLVNALPTAVRTVIEIADYSLADSVRLKAATYIIDRTMGKDGNVGEEDEATKILRKLAGDQGGGN